MSGQSSGSENDATANDRSWTGRAGSDSRLGRVKQVTSAVLGGALLVRGLRRRTAPGAATAAVGGWLLLKAIRADPRLDRVIRSKTQNARRQEDDAIAPAATEVTRSTTIGKPADELYEAWRDPGHLSQVMGHFAEVTSSGDDRLRWTVHGPRGREVSWETFIVEDEPGELVRWETPPDAVVPNEGSIRFSPAPGDRGTKATLSVRFDPPGGAFGTAALRQLDLVPSTLAGEALRRFKSLLETGEIQTLEGNPSGRGTGGLI